MDYRKAISDRFKSKTNSGSTATIALALIGGIAVGALASLLLAPQSGEETRGMIRDKTKDLTGNLKDKLRWAKNNAEERASELADALKDKYKSAANGKHAHS